MQIDISHETAVNMARRLNQGVQAALGLDKAQSLKHGQSLEILSQALGYENWDTFCGLLKASSKADDNAGRKPAGVDPLEWSEEKKQNAERVGWRQTPPVVSKPFDFYWEAFACDEWGDGPSWAKVHVTQAFVDQVHSLQTKCLEFNAQMAVYENPAQWDCEDELRLQGDELNVSHLSLWFSARPKHADYAVETRILDIRDFFDAIDNPERRMSHLAWADGILFMDGSSAKNFAMGLLDNGDIDINESRIEKMPS